MNSLAKLGVGGALVAGALAETVMFAEMNQTGPSPKTEEAKEHHFQRVMVAGIAGAVIVAHSVYSMVKGS